MSGFSACLLRTGHHEMVFLDDTHRPRAVAWRPDPSWNGDFFSPAGKASWRAEFGFQKGGVPAPGEDPHLVAVGSIPGEYAAGGQHIALVQFIARAPGDIFGLGPSHATYVADERDGQLALFVRDLSVTADGGMISVWDGFLRSAHALALAAYRQAPGALVAAIGATGPTPPGTVLPPQAVQGPPAPSGDPIVQPHVVTTPPAPIAPPALAQGLPPWSPAAQRAEELRTIAREALFGAPDLLADLFDQAGVLDGIAITAIGIGWNGFKPLVVKAVKVSRLARRRRGDPRAIPPEDL